MKKLTKEQSEWLKNQLNEGHPLPDKRYGINLGHVNDIIDKSTEKEFPRHMPNGANIQIDYAPGNKNSFIKICLFDDGFVNYAKYLDANEFLQFAEGIAKVAEWVRENEADNSSCEE